MFAITDKKFTFVKDVERYSACFELNIKLSLNSDF